MMPVSLLLVSDDREARMLPKKHHRRFYSRLTNCYKNKHWKILIILNFLKKLTLALPYRTVERTNIWTSQSHTQLPMYFLAILFHNVKEHAVITRE